jgi:hypothetical protein
LNIDRHAESHFRHLNERSKGKAMSGEGSEALKVFKGNPEGVEPHEGTLRTMDVTLHRMQSDPCVGEFPGDPRLITSLVQTRCETRWRRSRGDDQATSLVGRVRGENPEEGISDVVAGHGSRKVQKGVNRRERAKRWGRNASRSGILLTSGLFALKPRWRQEIPRKASHWLSPGTGNGGTNSEEAASSREEYFHQIDDRSPRYGKPRRPVGNDRGQGGKSQPNMLLRSCVPDSGEQQNLMRGSRRSG